MLCDMFLRKDVLFEGPIVAPSHLEDQVPKTPILGRVNMHFQACHAKY